MVGHIKLTPEVNCMQSEFDWMEAVVVLIYLKIDLKFIYLTKEIIMKQNLNRPARLAVNEIDNAVELALKRVAEAHELSREECAQVGGAVSSKPVVAELGEGGILTGLMVYPGNSLPGFDSLA